MKPIKWLIFLICLSLLTGCATRGEIDQANALIEELRTQVEQKDRELLSKAAEFEGSLSVTEAQLAESTTKISDLEAQLSASKEELAKMAAERDDINGQLKSSSDELSKKRSEIAKLQIQVDKLICKDQITGMSYTNVIDATNALKIWWSQQSGVRRVKDAYRDKIWSNALTGVHGIQYVLDDDGEEYVEHFLVFFNEFEMKPGVFWVKGQCWLDAP